MNSSATERLRAFIASNFYVPKGQSIEENTSFLDNGIIDSTGVLEIVAFIEREFEIDVKDHELVPANFDSLAALSAFIHRKKDTAHVLHG